MQEFMNWRRSNGKRAGGSPATINKDLGSLKTFFKWAFRNGYVDRPIEFDKPKIKQNRRTHFDCK